MRQFLRFFVSSAAGLVVDLALFALLWWLGVQPGIANAISAATSVTLVYVLVTRFTFPQRMRWWTYVLFIAWYLTSIAVISVAIQLLAASTVIDAGWWKLVSVPISFLANYVFSRLLFARFMARDRETASPDD